MNREIYTNEPYSKKISILAVECHVCDEFTHNNINDNRNLGVEWGAL